jgi:glycosyltransferase involved in cell wall biosynthesis
VEKLTLKPKRKILCINPGASRTGAPLLFLSFIKYLTEKPDFEISILYCTKGDLENEFSRYGETFFWNGWDEAKNIEKYYFYRVFKRIYNKVFGSNSISFQEKLIENLSRKQFDLVYANTVASCEVINKLKKKFQCPFVLHVRELEIAITQFGGKEEFRSSIPLISHFISDSMAVRNNLIASHNITANRITTVYEYVNCADLYKTAAQKGFLRKEKRKELDIPDDAFVVGSSGTTDWRKSPDAMLQIAYDLIVRKNDVVYFIWVGGDCSGIEHQKLIYDCEKMGIIKYIRFTGNKVDPVDYFACFDLFLLCSREEPVGVVAMESAAFETPVIYFENAGGINEFTEDAGIPVPYLDTIAASQAIIKLMKDPSLRKKLGGALKNKLMNYDVHLAGAKMKKIFNEICIEQPKGYNEIQ